MLAIKQNDQPKLKLQEYSEYGKLLKTSFSTQVTVKNKGLRIFGRGVEKFPTYECTARAKFWW
jgi:hypothetical protein